jgi:tetraacyldisaccharide 4'-kinase
MKAPRFWSNPEATAGALMAPLGLLYDLAGRSLRARQKTQTIDVPVVCIGNLTAGGAGKTPVAIALAGLLADRDPAFLTRGYGGRERGPLQVDPVTHSAADVGDEPLLLARAAPTWVSADRPTGGRIAITAGTRLVIMDDGFQNLSLHKDISLIVVDGGTGFGNGRVMPAGPLRETIDAGLSRADAIVLVGADHTGIRDAYADRLPVFTAKATPAPAANDLRGQRVLAFAGIGRPEKFFDTLAEMDCELVSCVPFGDHDPYTPERIMRLCEDAASLKSIPVTTEKDLVRMPVEARAMVRALPVAIAWDDEAAIVAFLREKLAR